MAKNGVQVLLPFLLLTLYSAAANTDSQSQADFQKEARISIDQAQKTALAAQPGKLINGGLEKKQRKLVYDFDIQTPDGNINEVAVDAKTGKIAWQHREHTGKLGRPLRLKSKTRRIKY